MTFACISPDEVRKKFRLADDKDYMLGVLADLTVSTKAEVKEFLGVGKDDLKARKAPVRLDAELTMSLYNLGLWDGAIAMYMESGKSTIAHWRRRNGLQPNNMPQDERMALYQMGFDDVKIAKFTGLTKKQIFKWRHTNGLPANGQQIGKKKEAEKNEKGEPNV